MSTRITMVCAEAVQKGGETGEIRLTGTPRVGSRSHWQSHVDQINLRNGFQTLNARKPSAFTLQALRVISINVL